MTIRPCLVYAVLAATAAALGAQDAAQNSSYQGQSHPPADDIIITTTIPTPKPPAGQPMTLPAADTQQLAPSAPVYSQPAQTQPYQPMPSSAASSMSFPAPRAEDGTDGGIVQVAPTMPPPQPMGLSSRAAAYDPDGDIVHPMALRPGELQEGTTIRVHLLDRVATDDAVKGQPFRTQVASDVIQGAQVVIPAGSEIDGRVVQVSAGSFGGRGTMRLQPESVVLPDGSRHSLHAEVSATPGSNTRVNGEGTIRPGSRVKKDSIEYGGGVGGGVVVGAVLGGPVGALTGGIIGAGAVTVHLLVDHPQAALEPGSTLIFQLTDPLFLAPEAMSGN